MNQSGSPFPPMPRRRFGRTGLQMPLFSCGGMRFQASWDGAGAEDHNEETNNILDRLIRTGIDLGINHIETARGYGTSEFELGKVLPHIPRDDFIMQTKIGPKSTMKEFRETFEESMRTLKLDHLDLLSLHGINNSETRQWALDGCLEQALTWKEEGRCRFVGFSTHAPLPIILQMINTGVLDYINIHWYYVNLINWPAVLAARQQDMGVFIISPNDKGGKLYDPPDSLRELCFPLTPMQFNDLWCLAHDEIHTLSLGAARVEDFTEHLDGLAHYNNRHELTATIAGHLDTKMTEAVAADWKTWWYQGIPESTETPDGINIREILRLWSFAKGLDMVEFARMRYNLLGNGSHWFPGSNAAAFDETAIRHAVRYSPHADQIPATLREAHALLGDTPKKRLSQGG